MQQFSALELVGKTTLDKNIYDANGQVVFRAGSHLTPDIIMKMSFMQLFVKKAQPKTTIVKSVVKNPSGIQSIISEEVTEALIGNTKKILEDAMSGKQVDVNVCEETRDIILDEISDKLNEADCIGQLRVFDEYTYSHTVNVSSMCSALGMMLNFSEEDLKKLALGGLLHDIGKMRISKLILNKPDKLTDDEFQEMKNHTVYGYNIIKNELHLEEEVALVALQHQEKYGGKGYPNGLIGKEISVFAQVASVCDVYDALVSERVYKKAMPSHEAIKIMLAEGGRSFNPYMLYKFIYLANYKDTTTIKMPDISGDGKDVPPDAVDSTV